VIGQGAVNNVHAVIFAMESHVRFIKKLTHFYAFVHLENGVNVEPDVYCAVSHGILPERVSHGEPFLVLVSVPG
jgi:hypothetical protein